MVKTLAYHSMWKEEENTYNRHSLFRNGKTYSVGKYYYTYWN